MLSKSRVYLAILGLSLCFLQPVLADGDISSAKQTAID